MIRRFVCLLLVPVMLANQGLCFAHSHRAADTAEPEGHASRPHFHFGGHGHHESPHGHDHHSHRHDTDRDTDRDAQANGHSGDCASFNRPAADHDANAVYGNQTVMLAPDGRTASVVSAAEFTSSTILQTTHHYDDWMLRPGPLRGRSSSVFDAACPLYLRTLSVRI